MKTQNPIPESHFFISSNGSATRKPQTPPTDIELTTIAGAPASYTSLCDVIAVGGAMSPTAPDSPTGWKSTFRDDVSIRNPLLKQAALAYLQPLSSPAETDDRSWTERISANLNRCFHVDGEGAAIGCTGPLNGVVLKPIKEVIERILRAFSTDRGGSPRLNR